MSTLFGQTAGEKWLQLESDYLHKFTVFQTQWPYTVPSLQSGSFSLDGLHTVPADNGGPILLVRNESSQTPCANDFKEKLRVFTSSGQLLTEFIWDLDDVVAFGWTFQECIAAITKDGSIYTFNIHGKRISVSDIDDRDGQDIIQVNYAQITRYGIICTFSTLPTKVAYYSFANHTTTFYKELPRDVTITTVGQIVPSSTHIVNANWTYGQYDEDTEFLLTDLNNEDRFKLFPKILVAAINPNKTTTLYILTQYNLTEIHSLVPSIIRKMTIDSSQQYVALLGEDRIIYCISLRTNTILYQFQCQSKSLPQNMCFIGSSSLLSHTLDDGIHSYDDDNTHPNIFLHWNIKKQSVAMVIGNTTQFRSFTWPTSTIIIGEPDYTVRVISETTCDLVQCLHPDLVATLTDQSTTPATQLLSSFLQFKTNHIQSDIILRRLIDSNQLGLAIKCVLNAANHCLYEPIQTILLQVCSYGRTYVTQEEDVSADEFVDACKIARLLCNIRRTILGIPLTYTLLNTYFTPEMLILRITTYHQHALAVKICAMMKIPADTVVRDWCMTKLLFESNNRHGNDNRNIDLLSPTNKKSQSILATYLSKLTSGQQLVINISHKLKSCKTRSYVPLSLWAAKYHQLNVAIALAYYEPISIHQTTLFVSLNEFNAALRTAYTSNDYELLIVTINRIYDVLEPKSSFFKLLHLYPDIELIYLQYLAKNQYDLFCEHTQSIPTPAINTLRFTYHSLYQLQYGRDGNTLMSNSAQKNIQIENGEQMLSNYKQFCHDVKEDKNGIMMTNFGQLLTEHDELLQIQKKYINTTTSTGVQILPDDSLGLSLIETIKILYRNNQEPIVNMLKDVFKLTDQRLSFIHVQILIQKEDWSTLQSKATTFASHLGGFEYIIETLVEAKATNQAIRYIELLPKYTQQLDWLCNLDLYVEAAQVAYKAKDIDSLRQIRGMCTTNSQQTAVDRLLQELK